MSENYSRRYVKDFNWKKFLFQLFGVYCVGLPIFWLFYKIELRGAKNVPKNQKFICAPNHISYFDPFIAAYAIKCPVAFMAKKELFESERMAKTLDGLGAFSVNREKLEVSTIKTAKEIFKTKDWILGIFPQGGIRKNKTIENINKGFAVLAKSAKWDILPVSITGVEEYNWVPFKAKLIVEVGELISHNQEVDEIIDEWGRKISQMSGYNHIPTTQESEKTTVKI